MSASASELLRALIERRSQGSLPISEWGPVCAACGGEEYRIDGYCSLECRDRYEYDEELALPLIADVVEAAERMQENYRAEPDSEYRIRFWQSWDEFAVALTALTEAYRGRAHEPGR